MKIKIELNGTNYSIDQDQVEYISLQVNFNGEQPNTYDVDKASARAYEAGSFIGDTRRGGGCNFEEYRIIPHCNGTHTECVGHISFERIPVNSILKNILIPSTLITVKPVKASETEDNYDPVKNDTDMIITAESIKEKVESSDRDFLNGLIIRTLPNGPDKMTRRYSQDIPPFLSLEAMNYIRSLNIEHLLLDVPSVDRTFDEGKLSAHHIFWDVKSLSHDVNPDNCSARTITEMVYVPDSVTDGKYFVSIQIPDFSSDAAPSRVMLYEIAELPE